MNIIEETLINNVAVLEFGGVYTNSKAPNGAFTNEFSISVSIGQNSDNAAFEIENCGLEEDAANQILIIDKETAIAMANFILKSFA